MLAKILAFRREPAPPADRNWTEQDRAEFFRVIDSLGRSGIPLELETGLTDEDEPWAVFCAPESGDPVVHIARLDGRYVLITGILPGALEGHDLHALVRQALDRLPAVVLPQSSGRGHGTGFMLHPAALLLVLVATCWYQTVQAAEPGAEVWQAAEHMTDAAALPNAPPAMDAAGPAVDGGTADAGPDMSLQRFQQILSIAVAFVSLQGDVGDLMAPPAPLPVALAEAPAQRAEVPAQTAGEQAEMTDSAPVPIPTDHALDDRTALAQDGLAPAEPHLPPTPTIDDLVIVADLLPARPEAASAMPAGGNAALMPIHWLDNGWAADWVLPPQAGQALNTLDILRQVAVHTDAAAQPAGGTPAATPHASGVEANASPAAVHYIDAVAAWSLIQPAKQAFAVSDLSPELSQKFAALIAVDAPLGKIIAVPTEMAAALPTTAHAAETAAALPVTADAADTPAPVVVSTAPPAASPPQAATTAAPQPTSKSADVAPAHPPASADTDLSHKPAVLPSTVTLLTDAGTTAARSQQVSFEDALAQLQHFTASTQGYVTIAANKSLVVIDQAVLSNTELPHAYSSVQLPDGSEIAWVYPVGVSPGSWHI
ncbi:hypothetical protein [Paracraurococcus lichenis]|uniref:Uncharacterized protein n=1 Tax=Paracraurococcus lichenis TaxID=3064888 RepID=A0ABT9EDN9_9PROT|nr:hypothetical protein [Paracraurococcus sp. LOR1-02]MDO9714000.1 hypothetical protein [Paracraurococcus sp. LOR1-02]